MVSGKIKPPAIDLKNEDLVRSHLHAIWLAETGVSLGRSLKDVLPLSGEPPSLALQEGIASDIAKTAAAALTKTRAMSVLSTIAEVVEAEWWSEDWLSAAITGAPLAFDRAADRWRDLYRAASSQQRIQNTIVMDHTRSSEEKKRAIRLRSEAEKQMELLLNDTRTDYQSDFYSYRYFASEGFLPGYNFPRLPISAFVPARRSRRTDEDWLSRPRFVAVQEFGPQALIYHEGSVYRVNRVMLPVGDHVGPNDGPVITIGGVQCTTCGYLHGGPAGNGPDLCKMCRNLLADHGQTFANLFRMTSVSTRRHERINSNQEERQRRGYEIRTGFSWAEIGGQPAVRHADALSAEGEPLASLDYGPTATLTLINLGGQAGRTAPRSATCSRSKRVSGRRNPATTTRTTRLLARSGSCLSSRTAATRWCSNRPFLPTSPTANSSWHLSKRRSRTPCRSCTTSKTRNWRRPHCRMASGEARSSSTKPPKAVPGYCDTWPRMPPLSSGCLGRPLSNATSTPTRARTCAMPRALPRIAKRPATTA